MSVVLEFKSKAGLKASKQVNRFVEYARKLTVFDHADSPLEWSSNNWSTWSTSKAGLPTFLKAGVPAAKSGSSQAKEEYWLDPSIRDFAKAYIRYTQGRNPVKNPNQIKALRLLEKALLELRNKADISLVDEDVLHHAAHLASEFYAGASYAAGGQLEMLAKFLSEKEMVERPLVWKNPIARKLDLHKGHRARKDDAKEKMPDELALDALAEIFALKPALHRDIVATSMVAILISAPSRISELLELPVDCVVTEWNHTDQQEELMLRWHAKKHGGHMMKFIPATMADVAREGIARITEITREPRKLAKFLESNPDQFPPHSRLPKVKSDSFLTSEQIYEALALNTSYPSKPGIKRTEVRLWLSQRLKAVKEKLRKDKSYSEVHSILERALSGMPAKKSRVDEVEDKPTLTLESLNRVVRKLYLPDNFPYTTSDQIIKCSDALLCFFYNQLNTQFDTTRPYSLQNFTATWLNGCIGVSEGRKDEQTSIFKRWKYFGDHYKVSSHQFRHHLNTLAQRGKAGELEIARWSGRANLRDNAAYNHMSEVEHFDRMKELGVGSKSALIAKSRNNQPITVAELEGQGDRIAHVTLYGACVHDFSMEPCPHHRDCLSCGKHRCIKGEEEKLRRIKDLKSKIEVQLKNALAASEKNWVGSDRWVALYQGKLERAYQLVDILENPEIEEGSIIHMTSDVQFSPIKRVLAEKVAPETLQLENQKDKTTAELESLRKLLGR